MNTDVDRCNRSVLALTNSAVHIPGNGVCVDNKNPHSPACNVSVLNLLLMILLHGIY